jgi:acyl transferase domain-containing protein
MKVYQDDIAIVGMAGLFPNCPDLAVFWSNLLSKTCCISDHPDPAARAFLDAAPGAVSRVYSLRGGYLGGLARFDPMRHGIMPADLAGGDPDQFLALQVAQDAVLDAGLEPANMPRERTEVILGHGNYFNAGLVGWILNGAVVDQFLDVLRQLVPDLSEAEVRDVAERLRSSLPPITPQTPATAIPNIVAGRTANRLDLMGANYTIDAACASSLIAVDHAVKDLLLDRCDLALAGGVQTSLFVLEMMLFCTLNALSRHAALRPFDQQADGTMLGEGAGILVLKRRREAEKDGNRIYAVIKGVGLASDGRAQGLLAPRQEGQVLAIRRAYKTAGVDPATVELVEAHGTGIPLGDATEIQSLAQVFGPRSGKQPTCAVGSVKSMVGHCRPAAGAAGLIKAALALYHKILPPTLNCEHPNSALGLERTPFYINTEARPWVRGHAATPRRAGISAMGFGGIDSHCVLEEHEGSHARER